MARKLSYNTSVVVATMLNNGIPEPEFEFKFHPVRKWRFDLAWPEKKLYLEVDGGIWIKGGHNRGAQMKKDWEKRNAASILGWRGLWCEPKDLLKKETLDVIKDALNEEN